MTNILLVLVLLALLANLVVSVNRDGSGSTDDALRDLLSLLFVSVVLCHVTCGWVGIVVCTRLLERRDRASLRFARLGYLWGLLALGVLASGPLFDVPIHQVTFALFVFLGPGALSLIGLYKELPQPARQHPIVMPMSEPDAAEEPDDVAAEPQTDDPPSAS